MEEEEEEGEGRGLRAEPYMWGGGFGDAGGGIGAWQRDEEWSRALVEDVARVGVAEREGARRGEARVGGWGEARMTGDRAALRDRMAEGGVWVGQQQGDNQIGRVSGEGQADGSMPGVGGRRKRDGGAEEVEEEEEEEEEEGNGVKHLSSASAIAEYLDMQTERIRRYAEDQIMPMQYE